MKSKRALTIFDGETTTGCASLKLSLRESGLRSSRLGLARSPRHLRTVSCLPHQLPTANSQMLASSAVINQNQTTPSEFFKVKPLEERLLSVHEEKHELNSEHTLFLFLMHEKGEKRRGGLADSRRSQPRSRQSIERSKTEKVGIAESLRDQIERAQQFIETLSPEHNSPPRESEGRGKLDSFNKASEEVTGSSNSMPKFYSEIVSLRGKRPLVANYLESLKRLEDENKELREKVVQQKLQELKL